MDSVLAELNPSIVTKIELIQKDGNSFLKCFDSFTDDERQEIISSPALFNYIRDVIMKSEEDTDELQLVMPFLFYCISSEELNIKCFAVKMTPFVLYSYLKFYFTDSAVLSYEVFLQKVVYVESQVKTKQSVSPVYELPSVAIVGTASSNMTSSNLQLFQRAQETERESIPSSIQSLHDSYITYIIACISIQKRYLPYLFKEKDTLLNLYKVLLNSKDVDMFPSIRVISPLPDRVIIAICNILKGIRCVCGDSPLLQSCFKAVKSVATTSNNESVIMASILI